jgi:hypothetical protein
MNAPGPRCSFALSLVGSSVGSSVGSLVGSFVRSFIASANLEATAAEVEKDGERLTQSSAGLPSSTRSASSCPSSSSKHCTIKPRHTNSAYASLSPSKVGASWRRRRIEGAAKMRKRRNGRKKNEKRMRSVRERERERERARRRRRKNRKKRRAERRGLSQTKRIELHAPLQQQPDLRRLSRTKRCPGSSSPVQRRFRASHSRGQMHRESRRSRGCWRGERRAGCCCWPVGWLVGWLVGWRVVGASGGQGGQGGSGEVGGGRATVAAAREGGTCQEPWYDRCSRSGRRLRTEGRRSCEKLRSLSSSGSTPGPRGASPR